MTIWKRPFSWLLLFTILAFGCQGQTPADDDTVAVVPTALMPTAAATEASGAEALPTAVQPTEPAAPATSVPSTATQPTPTPTTPPPSPSATPVPDSSTDDAQLKVAFVTNDDVLNVRAGPGVEFEIVGALPPDARNVTITGAGELVSGSRWVPIQAGNVSGWVNSRFLTGSIAAEPFCNSGDRQALVDQLETAVANRDGDALAALVHPERGLRIHHNWWNPVQRFDGGEVAQLFSSRQALDWGIADGSGNPIVGSFSEIILPMLDEDLLGAEQIACDAILSGGTAGIVRVPDGYEAVLPVSFFRPGTEEFAGMDWGSWVVGVEQWNGRYFISYLIHFEWEI